MKTEFEIRILEIDVNDMIEKLEKLWAQRIAEREMRRFVYDFSPKKEWSWIRLRFDWTKTTLAIKEIQNDQIDGTKELEISVEDFDKTNLILEKLGYKFRNYQENRRISYKLDNVEIEIDFWPLIPPYLEIEGKTIEDVEKAVNKIGFDMQQTTSINTIKIYKQYWIDLDSIKELKV